MSFPAKWYQLWVADIGTGTDLRVRGAKWSFVINAPEEEA